MKFGVFISAQQPRSDDPVRRFQEALEQARLARDRVPRMLEALGLIRRLWTEEAVTFEGRFFRVHDATCTIRPVQLPYPPIWIAANADPAVVRTARLGYPWFVNPHAALPTIERQWERYKQALAEANHPMPSARPIALELHV